MRVAAKGGLLLGGDDSVEARVGVFSHAEGEARHAASRTTAKASSSSSSSVSSGACAAATGVGASAARTDHSFLGAVAYIYTAAEATAAPTALAAVSADPNRRAEAPVVINMAIDVAKT